MLEKGTNINDKNEYENIPLILASLKGYKGIIKLLAEAGDIINDKDKYGNML